MRTIIKYQCENCFEKFDDKYHIHKCEECGKEVCLFCSDIINNKYYCVSCGLNKRIYKE